MKMAGENVGEASDLSRFTNLLKCAIYCNFCLPLP